MFAWDELRKLAEDNLEAARMKLADILCNYQGYSKKNVILVFDGHKAKGNLGSVIPYHNISIIYTKEAETADQYIEKVTRQFDRKYCGDIRCLRTTHHYGSRSDEAFCKRIEGRNK